MPLLAITGVPQAKASATVIAKFSLREGCGWWVAVEEAAWTAALRQTLSRPRAELIEMGTRGRAWMERDFGWPQIAEEMLAVYSWLAGKAARPNCVTTDQ